MEGVEHGEATAMKGFGAGEWHKFSLFQGI